MVIAYSSKTVKSMDSSMIDKITNLGIPIEIYTKGTVNLGPNNKKSLAKFTNLVTLITENNLPLPPSRASEFIVDTIFDKDSKKDYRISLDGLPGSGKSYTSFGKSCRYAMNAAELNGQDPKDYFSFSNCALLQDADGVTQLLDETEKYQAVIIDDAGVSVSNRNWNSPENKAIGAIMQTCRTKRWFMIYNMPNRRYIDNQVRDLVYARAYVYKPCHSALFNIIKLNSIALNLDYRNDKEFKNRFAFDGNKINYHAAFSPDLLDPYQGMIKKYDVLREIGGSTIIHDRAVRQKERKTPESPAEKRWKEKIEKHYPTIFEECKSKSESGEKIKRSELAIKTGLTDRDIIKMLAIYNQGIKP